MSKSSRLSRSTGLHSRMRGGALLSLCALLSGLSLACKPGDPFGPEITFTQLSVDPGKVVVLQGEGETVSARPTDGKGASAPVPSGSDVEWMSNNPLVATIQVDPNDGNKALIVGEMVGETVVRATLQGKTVDIPVTVTNMRSCSQEQDLVRRVARALNAPELCLKATESLYSGPIDHSWHSETDIPLQPQPDDYTRLTMVGGQLRLEPTSGFVAKLREEGLRDEVVTAGGGLDPATEGPVLILWAEFQEEIPRTPDRYVEYSLALDLDWLPENNITLRAEFADDWARDSDFVYQLGYTPDTDSWGIKALDISNTSGTPTPPVPVETDAQVMFEGRTVLWVIPWTGRTDGPLFRWTGFGHKGDFGFNMPFTGDYFPPPGQSLYSLSNYADY